MKRILFSVLAVILLLLLTIGALELFSSYTASDKININAPVQTAQKIVIHAAPEKIWTIMSRIDQWADWHGEVQQPKLNGPFQSGTTFNWKSGGLTIHSTLNTVTPYSKIGWSGKAFGAFAIHNWTFTPVNGYTEVLVEESMEGWLVNLMQKKFQAGLKQSLHSWLNNLKIEAEK